MAKNLSRFVKLVLTGFFWLFFYLEITVNYCFYYLNFNLLSRDDWRRHITSFLSSDWIIDDSRDFITLLIMILFIPLFFVGWFFVYQVKWKNVYAKIRPKKKVIENKKFSIDTAKKNFEPHKLRVQSNALFSTPLQDKNSTDNAPVPDFSGNIDTATPIMPSAEEFPDAAEVQEMMEFCASTHADFFPHILLEGSYASFALSTEKKAVVVKIINQPDSVWAVDTATNILSSDWFSERNIVQAPAKDILTIANNLQQNEPESTVISVILLMSGKLLNSEETLDYFEKNNILLCRMDLADADDVPLFSDFLKDFFQGV